MAITQERHLFWRPPGHVGRRVRPDIVVRSASAAAPALLIVDTKWKVPTNGVPSDEDLKQMFVYNELLSGVRSVLIYPSTRTAMPMRASYERREHSCEQAHLDLAPDGRWSTADMQVQISTLIHCRDATARGE